MSKRSAPSGAVTQILPLPSQSTVVAPPVGDMAFGGMKTSIFSVFGSSLREAAAARIDVEPDDAVRRRASCRGCCAASPLLSLSTLNDFTVAGLARRCLADGGARFGQVAGEPDVAVEIGQRVVHAASREIATACRATSRCRRSTSLAGRPVSGSSGTSYSREHDARGLARRAAAGSLTFMRAFARPARAREIGGELLLVVLDDARAPCARRRDRRRRR